MEGDLDLFGTQLVIEERLVSDEAGVPLGGDWHALAQQEQWSLGIESCDLETSDQLTHDDSWERPEPGFDNGEETQEQLDGEVLKIIE